MALLEVEDLTYFYPGSEQPVLKNISFKVEEGETVLLLGRSASGKSTLLNCLGGILPQAPGQTRQGTILFKGKEITLWDARELRSQIGLLLQRAEAQLIAGLVLNDLAFGLENLGTDPQTMRLRVAEVADLLGIAHLLPNRIEDLSTGEKKKVALAGVLATRPRVLLLDEPLGNLDPLTAKELLSHLRYINQELGITLILAEQRPEDILLWADQILVLEQGQILMATDQGHLYQLLDKRTELYLPPASRLAACEVRKGSHQFSLALTLKDIKKHLVLEEPMATATTVAPTSNPTHKNTDSRVAFLNRVWVTYPNGKEALRGISLSLAQGEAVGIMGVNGAGKTTLLKTLCGLVSPVEGKVDVLGFTGKNVKAEKLAGQVAYLPQDPGIMLWQETVEKEINLTPKRLGRMIPEWIQSLIEAFELKELLPKSPRELSMGERTKVALAAILASRPQLLLLDEPTLGLDPWDKLQLQYFLRSLVQQGITVVASSHDPDFVSEWAERVVILSQGKKATDDHKYKVFKDSTYYASQISRLFAEICPEVTNYREAVDYLANQKIRRVKNGLCT